MSLGKLPEDEEAMLATKTGIFRCPKTTGSSTDS
jgi:hypothetical protein